MELYDLIIVGAGPSGLALAHYASAKDKKILILEKENEIGGCHKVHRVLDEESKELLFSEHGPRVYSNSYMNFKNILKDIGTTFDKTFTPYNFNFTTVGGYSLSTMESRELFYLTIEFLKFLYDENHGKNITVLQFSKKNNFSKKSIEYLDAICRLTDGATADKYTLFQFLNLVDQQIFYSLYQPRLPNDISLFTKWRTYLENKKVTIKTNEEVTIQKNKNFIVSLNNKYKADEYVFAIPPESLVKVLEENDIREEFGKELKEYSKKTEYIEYISISYHWDKKLDIEKIWGLPKNDWGVGFIISSDYTKFSEQTSQTVISAIITKTDSISSYTNKTVKESKDDEIIIETFRQLELDLPNPTKSIIYPLKEKAYVANIDSYTYTIPFKANTLKNMYSLGVHSKKSDYNFTTLESAVINAKAFSNELYNTPKPRKMITTLRSVIRTILFFILAILFLNYV